MNIAFVDLKRQNKQHKREFLAVFDEILDKSVFVDGKPVLEFEKRFASFCNKKYAVGLNSGTDAILFALLAYNIGRGDEVITAANSYFSPAMMISQVGATPVFVDVDPTTGNIDTTLVKKAITKKTKAILPTHLCGQAANMMPIITLAKKHNLIIIEDACQAHGAKYKGHILPVTETGTFSFYPGKNLGCFGDGGALVTDNKNIYNRVLKLRNDGSTEKYIHTELGYKSRLDTLQAAILLRKLTQINSWNRNRRILAALYTDLLKGIKQVTTPTELPENYHVYHLYMIECQNRDKLQKFLAKKGITTVIHYPTPIHLQKPYKAMGFRSGMFPIAEKRAKRILSLPMFPELTKKEVQLICLAIKEFYE